MGKLTKPISLLLALCLAGSLCACGGGGGGEPPAATPAPPRTEGAGAADVPGEDAANQVPAPEAAETPSAPVQTDGLEGSYFNDYLRQTLTLDGQGSCTLAFSGTEDSGSYSRDAYGILTLTLENGTETASVDADGDILIAGRTGYYLRNWSFWGITASEANVGGGNEASELNVVDNGDGTFRCRDFDNAIAFTYPAGMSVAEARLIGGVAVGDGKGGYVTGRNVTDLYYTHSGSDDEFLSDYVRTFVFTDFGILYDGVRSFEPLTLLHEGVDGRLAAATLSITGGTQTVAVKVLLYTSTYPDGTVNRICKTVFAPADTGTDALEAAVTNMSAVRLVAES